MRVLLNDEEQAALLEASPEAGRVYVLGLRPLMDVRTGLVGVSSHVSYGGLAVGLQWRPERGSTRRPFAPTNKVIRGLVDELVRYGLVKRYSLTSKDEMRLQILLPLAGRAQLRPVEDGQMMGRGSATGQSPATTGFAGNDGQMAGNEDGQISVNRRENPFSGQAAADAPPVVDGAREADALPRAVALCKLLRQQGVEATPAQLRRPEVLALANRSDADWLAAVATARMRKGDSAIVLGYLLPIVRDIAENPAGKVEKLGAGGGGHRKGGGRFNPAAYLDELFGGDDDECIVGSAKRLD